MYLSDHLLAASLARVDEIQLLSIWESCLPPSLLWGKPIVLDAGRCSQSPLEDTIKNCLCLPS